MIRLWIRHALQKAGYDIVKYHPEYVVGKFDRDSLIKEFDWLREFNFKTILDIGANEGQFADRISTVLPDATIYSFEPIPEVYEKLKKNFKDRPNLTAINSAVGDTTGELTFNENEYAASSSFLDITDRHADSFDYAVKTSPIKVKVDTLDHLMKDVPADRPLLMKIDVQGFEDKVISGAQEMLAKTDAIICEVSFVELFKGQLLFDGIYEKLKQSGFVFAGSIEQLRSTKNNAILQADAVFLRRQP